MIDCIRHCTVVVPVLAVRPGVRGSESVSSYLEFCTVHACAYAPRSCAYVPAHLSGTFAENTSLHC